MDSACGKITFTWSKEATEALIELYELYQCLYLTTSAQYTNKSIRNKSMQEICEKFNSKYFNQLTLKDIQSKIHGIRTQYLSEVETIKKSKVSGTSPDFVYTSKRKYFNKLEFIGSHGLITSQGESNMSNTQSQSSETPVLEINDADETPNGSQLIYYGDIENIDSLSILSPESIIYETSRPSFSCSQAPKKMKIVTTPKRSEQSSSKVLLDTATKAFNDLGPTSENVMSANTSFGPMIGLELDKVTNEAILDDLKLEILKLVFQAKRACSE